MAEFVAHFTVEENGEEVSRRGKLEFYDVIHSGKFQVKIDGQRKTYDVDKLNTIRWQIWQDDSQEELF